MLLSVLRRAAFPWCWVGEHCHRWCFFIRLFVVVTEDKKEDQDSSRFSRLHPCLLRIRASALPFSPASSLPPHPRLLSTSPCKASAVISTAHTAQLEMLLPEDCSCKGQGCPILLAPVVNVGSRPPPNISQAPRDTAPAGRWPSAPL